MEVPDFDIDSPEDFTNPDFKALDELVRCPICCDVMYTTTVIIKCSHNFCSLCIRRHVESKKQCPVCKEACTDSSLITNRLINQITLLYKNLRYKLLELDKERNIVHSSQRKERDKQDTRPPLSPPFNKSLDTSLPNQMSLISNFKLKKKASNGGNKTVKTTGEVSSYQTVSASSSSTNVDTVECPVCSCVLQQTKLNHHLDMCLKRKERQDNTGQVPTKKKLPSLVWSLKSEKSLKEQCKKYNLSTAGKKTELIKRLKEYTLRYNSQIDQLRQKSDIELAREVEKVEKIQLKSPPCVLVNLKSEKDRADYSKKHDGQFLKLINAASRTHKSGITQRKPPLEPNEDDLQIIHEIQASPKNKCNGSLLGYFKSPSKTPKTPPSTIISSFGSNNPKPNTSPKTSLLPASSPDLTAAKSLFSSSQSPQYAPSILKRSSSNDNLFDDDSDFDDVDFDEIDRSSTQQQKHGQCSTSTPKNTNVDALLRNHLKSSKAGPSNNKKVPDSPLSESLFYASSGSTIAPSEIVPFSPETPSKKRKTPQSSAPNILNHVIAVSDNDFIEQEVSRLYKKDNEENNSSVLNTSHTSKLDRILEKSYKKSKMTEPKFKREGLDESMSEMLQDLDRSSPPTIVSPTEENDHMFDSPPIELPSLDDEDLPDYFKDLDDLPPSPIIVSSRRQKRSSSSCNNEINPKRGRKL